MRLMRGGVKPSFKYRPSAGKQALRDHLGFSYLRTPPLPKLINSATPLLLRKFGIPVAQSLPFQDLRYNRNAINSRTYQLTKFRKLRMKFNKNNIGQ